jgi:predicted O-methyltransferase YrrM
MPDARLDVGRPRPAGLRGRLRTLRFGLATVLGFRRRGFFIPHRYADRLPLGEAAGTYPEIARIFDDRRGAFAEFIAEIHALGPELEAIGDSPPPEPRWHQHWLPRLDAAALYTMIRRRRPRRVVEIGSGHSTRFAVRAVRDGGLETAVVTIDPAPRATLPTGDIRNYPVLLHEAPPELFGGLAAGDVLFVDSSHILMPGTDVDHLLNRIWPTLAAGVIVHFHDILLPDGYPAAWRWRGYNEQLGIATLIASGAAEILFSSHYAVHRMAEDLNRTVVARLPLAPDALETSLWLVKRGLNR